MTNQAELQPTINGSGEDSALRTNGEIPHNYVHGDATPLIRTMVEEYADIYSAYSDSYGSPDFGAEASLIDDADQKLKFKYLRGRQKQLTEVTRHAYGEGGLLIDPLELQNEKGPVSVYALADKYVSRLLAEVRVEKQMAERSLAGVMESPSSHVSYQSHDSDPDTTKSFKEIIRELVPEPMQHRIDHVLGKIGLGGFAISQPLQIITQQMNALDADRALLNDPEHAAEVTVAVDIHTVTPNQVLAMK